MKDTAPGQKKNSATYRVELLEPRLLLAADWLGGLAPAWSSDAEPQDIYGGLGDYLTDRSVPHPALNIPSSLPDALELNGILGLQYGDDGADDLAMPDPATDSADTRRHELVIIDAGVEGYQALVADFESRNGGDTIYEIHVLAADADGVLALTTLLAGFSDLDAIHIVSHGGDGGIQLGNTRLDVSTIDNYSDLVSSWSEALGENADLLIYGCNLAASEAGQALVGTLGALTQADVAASTDLTGQAQLGGDWDFEYNLGVIDSTIAFSAQIQSGWSGTLATFVVNTLDDTVDANPGDGLALDAFGNTSLRAAIMEANALPGLNTIYFEITDPLTGGVHIIMVGPGGLPTITEAVIIDATTDSHYNGTPIVELNGTLAGGTDGLNITASDSVIRGLIINRFQGDGIEIKGDNNRIELSYIGTDATGNADLGNGRFGIHINNASGNYIGGSGVGNVVSGNDLSGIGIDNAGSINNFIQGNLIGTNASGTAAIGNDEYGIDIWSGGPSDNTVGGVTSDLRNIVSGNAWAGIHINGSTATGNLIMGNYIGTNIDGSAGIANGSTGGGGKNGGIDIDGNANNNTIGGTVAGAGNLIAYNVGPGVHVDGGGTTGNAIQGNLIYANSGIGIEHAGGNENRVSPTISDVTTDGGSTVTVTGVYSDSTLGADTLTIEFYSNPGSNQEGRVFLGSITIVTDVTGSAPINTILSAGVAIGEYVTATITDSSGNTSEFSIGKAAVASNVAPVLSNENPTLGDIFEDDFTSVGDSISAIVVDGSVSDSDGPVESIAITAVDNSNGTWQYSIDNGVTWNDVDDGFLSAGHALLLDGTLSGASTQRLRFVPNADYSGSATFTFRAWDQSTGSAATYADTTVSGGTTAFSSATDTASIVINPVNDAPSFNTLGDQNVFEDSGPHTIAGFATALPGGGTDEFGQTFTYTISSDNPGLFLVGPFIDANGTLTYTLNANAVGTARITVSVTDSGGSANGGVDTSADQTFDIIVGAVNDVPNFSTLGDQNVLEDSGPHTIAGFATALPGGGTDESGQTFTYTISSDNPGLFLVGPFIDANGTLTYTLNANAVGTARITVSVTDSGGTADGGVDISADQTFDIIVGAVNDVPTFSTLGDQDVLEDSGPHTVAGFATALPGGGTDESGQTFTYTISSDNPGLFLVGPFIDANGTLTYTLNADAVGTARITVSVTDSGGTANGGVDTSADQTFDIIVGAVNDIPSFSMLRDQNVLEDSGPHTVAGFATALPGGGTDESGQTFTYTVSSDNPDLFLVGPFIDANGTLTYTLNANAVGTARITVSVTDSGGTANGGIDTSADQTFDIIVGAVNDAPNFSTLGDQDVLEDSGTHTVTGFATALPGGGTDESGQIFTYTVSSDNPGLFLVGPSIDANGTLTYTLNANVSGIAQITVSVTDSGGTTNGGVDTSLDQTFDIVVANSTPSASNLDQLHLYLEDSGPVDLHDILVNVGGNSGLVTATLTLSNVATGSLSADSGNGETYSHATGQWTITGTVSQVNAALAAVVFTPTENNDTDVTLSTHIESATGQGPADGLITLSVTPVNDSPSGEDGQVSVLSNSAYVFTLADFSFSDLVEGNAMLGIRIDSLPTSSGILINNGSAVSVGDVISAADIAAGRVQFVAVDSLDFGGIATLAFSVQDDGGTAAGGIDFDPTPNLLTIVVNQFFDADPDIATGIDNAPQTSVEVIDAVAANSSDDNVEDDLPAKQTPAEQTNSVRTVPPPVQLASLAGPVISGGFPLFRHHVELSEGSDDENTVTKPPEQSMPDADERDTDKGLTATPDDIERGLNQLRDAVAQNTANGRFELGGSTSAVLGLSVGYISWLLRGGVLLSSLLSSLPVWQFVDPLPVFARDRRSADGDDETLEGIVKAGAAKAKSIKPAALQSHSSNSAS